MFPISGPAEALGWARSFASNFPGIIHQKRAEPVLDSTETKNLESKTEREHIIIMILVGTIVLSFVGLLAYFFHRRYTQKANRKLREDLEAGRKEVTEARAFRPQDDTLKEGFYTPFEAEDGSIYVRTPVLQTPAASRQVNAAPATVLTRISVATVAGVDAHPLFHPGIKRSRTLPSKKVPQYSNRTLRGPISYPNIYGDKDQSLQSQPSSISLGSYYRTESKPMTTFSTMQTRRPETPPIEVDEPQRVANRRQIHSFWSVSDTASIAPTSPSIHSPTCPRELSPRPAPPQFGPSQTSYDGDSSISTNSKPIGTPIRPIFSIDREGTLPALSYPLPLLLRKSSATLPRIVLPLSPPASPRMVPPSGPCNISSLGQVSEPPTAKIERWLSGSGSTGTASIIESVLGSKRRSSEPDIYRTDDLPRSERVSPIRSMRSSRRSSGEEIFIGAAF
ncbi:hypothetical protein DL95DRAFT_483169 [Leptodontidium sp. 2 PMI_412]|nr:hypothetical protein BKA61DRAFT_576207 [Leptodontidium sp. MPI-SDFR-AT-0119]KAH9207451.1 hypothetical protein DL95DRAFT_483169 [Leptodontidium sp. 2 PMI_412]